MPPPLVNENDCRRYVEKLLFPPSKILMQAKPGAVGIELENFAYRITEQGPAQVSLYGKESLMDALLSVSGRSQGKVEQTKPDKNGIEKTTKIGFPEGDSFLFEPGGQVEISTAPCNSIKSLREHLVSKQEILGELTKQHAIQFGQHGTHPWLGDDMLVNQLQLPRYLALEKYFNSIGPFGRRMMLQTCSMHINLDAGHEESTRIKRIVAANLLVPFATALFANSPVLGGHNTGYKCYRSYIWQQADDLRTGILPLKLTAHAIDREILIDTYLNFGLNAPLIFIPELGQRMITRSNTLRYWLEHPIEGIRPHQHHLENHFTLLFPEVRLKDYLELRSVDAPPVEWQMVPVLFYVGLLYSDAHTELALDLLTPLADEIQHLYQAATAGMESDIICRISKKLVQLSIEGCQNLPAEFMPAEDIDQLVRFYKLFPEKRRTFADEFLSNEQ